jgi:Fe-Mn family superoxide dismutase
MKAAAGGTVGLILPLGVSAQGDPPHQLPKLPYAYDALEPHIDAETMTIHHTKHHKAYVDNLNTALSTKPELFNKTIEQLVSDLKSLPEAIQTAVRNNGGGHLNHTWFWNWMTPKKTECKGELLKAIEGSFTNLDGFKKAFADAATKRFGSGWAWLVRGKDKPLAITSSPNQDNPLMEGGTAPLLGLDVWEHAYYLKYRNLRAKYIEAFWNVVNWDMVAAAYAKK